MEIVVECPHNTINRPKVIEFAHENYSALSQMDKAQKAEGGFDLPISKGGERFREMDNANVNICAHYGKSRRNLRYVSSTQYPTLKADYSLWDQHELFALAHCLSKVQQCRVRIGDFVFV